MRHGNGMGQGNDATVLHGNDINLQGIRMMLHGSFGVSEYIELIIGRGGKEWKA
jgi:hypothetical protein